MRTVLFAPVLCLWMLALLPGASAAPSSLTLEMPDGEVTGNATIPVVVRLTLTDFMCHEPRDFVITLASNATDGVKALFEESSVRLRVEARSYFVDSYTAEATARLNVRSRVAGELDVSGAFAADDGPCFVPGGFAPATFTLARSVAPGAAPTEPPAATPAPPSPSEPAAPQGEPSAPPQPSTPMPTSSATSSGTGTAPPSCAPGKTCGYIGDYEAPAESAAISGTPGVGLLAIAGAVVGVALVARRK